MKHTLCPASALEASWVQGEPGGILLFGRMLYSEV